VHHPLTALKPMTERPVTAVVPIAHPDKTGASGTIGKGRDIGSIA
jgi:hypothetical protein